MSDKSEKSLFMMSAGLPDVQSEEATLPAVSAGLPQDQVETSPTLTCIPEALKAYSLQSKILRELLGHGEKQTPLQDKVTEKLPTTGDVAVCSLKHLSPAKTPPQQTQIPLKINEHTTSKQPICSPLQIESVDHVINKEGEAVHSQVRLSPPKTSPQPTQIVLESNDTLTMQPICSPLQIESVDQVINKEDGAVHSLEHLSPPKISPQEDQIVLESNDTITMQPICSPLQIETADQLINKEDGAVHSLEHLSPPKISPQEADLILLELNKVDTTTKQPICSPLQTETVDQLINKEAVYPLERLSPLKTSPQEDQIVLESNDTITMQPICSPLQIERVDQVINKEGEAVHSQVRLSPPKTSPQPTQIVLESNDTLTMQPICSPLQIETADQLINKEDGAVHSLEHLSPPKIYPQEADLILLELNKVDTTTKQPICSTLQTETVDQLINKEAVYPLERLSPTKTSPQPTQIVLESNDTITMQPICSPLQIETVNQLINNEAVCPLEHVSPAKVSPLKVETLNDIFEDSSPPFLKICTPQQNEEYDKLLNKDICSLLEHLSPSKMSPLKVQNLNDEDTVPTQQICSPLKLVAVEQLINKDAEAVCLLEHFSPDVKVSPLKSEVDTATIDQQIYIPLQHDDALNKLLNQEICSVEHPSPVLFSSQSDHIVPESSEESTSPQLQFCTPILKRIKTQQHSPPRLSPAILFVDSPLQAQIQKDASSDDENYSQNENSPKQSPKFVRSPLEGGLLERLLTEEEETRILGNAKQRLSFVVDSPPEYESLEELLMDESESEHNTPKAEDGGWDAFIANAIEEYVEYEELVKNKSVTKNADENLQSSQKNESSTPKEKETESSETKEDDISDVDEKENTETDQFEDQNKENTEEDMNNMSDDDNAETDIASESEEILNCEFDAEDFDEDDEMDECDLTVQDDKDTSPLNKPNFVDEEMRYSDTAPTIEASQLSEDLANCEATKPAEYDITASLPTASITEITSMLGPQNSHFDTPKTALSPVANKDEENSKMTQTDTTVVLNASTQTQNEGEILSKKRHAPNDSPTLESDEKKLKSCSSHEGLGLGMSVPAPKSEPVRTSIRLGLSRKAKLKSLLRNRYY